MIIKSILSAWLLLASVPASAADFYGTYNTGIWPGYFNDLAGPTYSYQMAEMACGPYGCRQRSYRTDRSEQGGEGYSTRPYGGRPYYGQRGYDDGWRRYDQPRDDYDRFRHCTMVAGVRVCN
jgi:hypothetical protein